MRTAAIGSVWTLFGLLASGQPSAQASQERVFHFAHARTATSVVSIATAIRVVGEMTVKTSQDSPPSTLTVQGTPEQLAFANWLFVALDQPVGAPANAAVSEFTLAGVSDNIVRIYSMTNAETVQQFQEIATAIRTVAEIRRLFTYNDTRTVIMRGTPDQMALTDWLFPLMDRPLRQPIQHGASSQSVIPAPHDDGVTQVFYAANAPTIKDFQELAITLRTITQTGRVFTYNDGRAIVMRGLAGQIDMAAWLFNELDQPGQTANSREYQTPGRDDVVRIFDLAHTGNAQDLQDIVTQIRASTNTQRAFSYGSRMGLALRGTAAQMALAEHLVQELDKP